MRAASPRLEAWVKGGLAPEVPERGYGGVPRFGPIGPDVVVPLGDTDVVGYRSAKKYVYSAKYHLMWCPKYGERSRVGAVETRLNGILAEVVDELGGEVIEVEVMPEQVHLLVEVPPQVPRSRLMQALNGRSSRLLRAEFPRRARMRCVWSRSWFCSTVGGAPLEVVRRDVEHQKQVA